MRTIFSPPKRFESKWREQTALNYKEFATVVAADPNLSGPLDRAGRSGLPRQYSIVNDAAAITLMFPIARYIVIHIGLPWAYELKRYSELQRRKIHAWIDEQSRAEGVDPSAAEAASEALCQELEQITGASVRASWEHLAEVMKTGSTKLAAKEISE
jgi:hypothetical protein